MATGPSPLSTATHAKLDGKKGLLLSVSQFATRFSDTDSILLIHGDVFSGPGFFFSGHNDPRSLSTFFESLKRNSRETWTQLKGQCSCLWISQGKIELFRSPFSPHLLFFNKDTVSDQLRILSSPNPKFSELYLKQFVLDYPSLQFSSSLTPLDNVYRVPPASIVTLTPGSDPLTEFLPTEPFMLHEGPAALEDVAKQLRDTLKSILDWHLAKRKC
ncbi:hypothetical protein EBT16_13135 [bacterium]|nr:hypothetical protein [bacterium]